MKEVIDMKRRMLFLILISSILFVMATACNGKDINEIGNQLVDNIEFDKAEGDVGSHEEKLMEEFNNAIKGDIEPFVLVKLIDENIGKVKTNVATEMINRLEEIQLGYIDRYTEELFMEEYQMELITLSEIFNSNSEDKEYSVEDYLFFDVEKIEEIKNENLKQLVERIIEGKFKLINMEGAYYPIIDYEGLKVYGDYISEEMNDYLDLKSMESNMPVILDGGITISFDELAERLIKTENYILKYPDGQKYEEVLRLYGIYLKFYFEGSPNTLIYDYESKIIKDEVLASYERLKNMEETVISQVVSKYIDIIMENDNIIDESVLSKVTELHSQAVAALEGQN